MSKEMEHRGMLGKNGSPENRQQPTQLTASSPKRWLPDFQLARLALQKVDLAAAEFHMGEAEARGLPLARSLDSRARIAIGKGDHSTARKLLERLVANSSRPESGQLLRLASACMKLGDSAAALKLAERVLTDDSRNAKAHGLVARVAVEGGDAARAEIAYSALIELEPENPRWLAQQQLLLSRVGAKEQAISLIHMGVERGLAGFELFRYVHLLALPAGIAEKVLLWARSVGADAPEEERVAANRLLASLGNQPFIPGHSTGVENGRREVSYDWLDDAPQDSELKRMRVVDSENGEVVVARADKPDAVALVFTGLGDQTFFPVHIFDRYLAALNLTAIYLRDSRRMLFNNGVMSVAPDFDGTVVYLQKLISELGSTRLVSIGTSAGGYAAIRYGLALGAERIVGFSALTNLRADFLADDGRGRIVARRLQSLPPEVLDVRPMVQAGKAQADIHLVYGENMRQDKCHALHLEGVPGVTLHPLAEVDVHASLLVLAREKKLMPFLTGTVFQSRQ